MRKLFLFGISLTVVLLLDNQVQAKEPLNQNNVILKLDQTEPLDSNVINTWAEYGVDEAGIEDIKSDFVANGVKEEVVLDVIFIMTRILPSVPANGEEFVFPEWAVNYCVDLGLTPEQIEMVRSRCVSVVSK